MEGFQVLPLLAAVDVLGIIIVVIIIVVSIVSNFYNEAKKNQQEQARAQRRPVGQPADKNVADEIKDFLRKSLGGQQQEAPPVQAQLAKRKPLRERHGEDTLVSRTSRQKLHSQIENRRVQTDVDEHIHETFGRDVGHIAQNDDVFARKKSSGKSPAKSFPPTSAAGLAALLSDTDNVRQAIVINEILQRPEQRWG